MSGILKFFSLLIMGAICWVLFLVLSAMGGVFAVLSIPFALVGGIILLPFAIAWLLIKVTFWLVIGGIATIFYIVLIIFILKLLF